MNDVIILKSAPKIKIQFLDNGFELIDKQTEQNTGFYAYSDLQTIELNKAWYPRLAKWLRALTWIMNGVPYFPEATSCKKANIIIHLKNTKLGIWLTDISMASKAKKLKEILDEKTTS